MQSITLLHSIAELAGVPGPLFLAIGVFDGVHLGHQAVIGRALADARSAGGEAVAVTFDPHPMRLLRPSQAPRLLTSTPHKIRLIENLGVRCILTIPFTSEFASKAPEDFIREIAAAANPLQEICVGYAWSFGKGRAGNLDLLAELGDSLGFNEVGVSAVQIDGQIVSSTIIRAAVEAGDLAAAARFLGRAYQIWGTVEAGRRLGRTLGFPTANLSAHCEQFPPDGVYAVEALWREQQLRGIVNIGIRPTVELAGKRTLELHIFDFDRDLYGEEIEVTFRGFIRPECKFNGLEELRFQIALDCKQAREILASNAT